MKYFLKYAHISININHLSSLNRACILPVPIARYNQEQPPAGYSVTSIYLVTVGKYLSLYSSLKVFLSGSLQSWGRIKSEDPWLLAICV